MAEQRAVGDQAGEHCWPGEAARIEKWAKPNVITAMTTIITPCTIGPSGPEWALVGWCAIASTLPAADRKAAPAMRSTLTVGSDMPPSCGHFASPEPP